MADRYTPERIEALAEFARYVHGYPRREPAVDHKMRSLGLCGVYGVADWLRPEDWADRAVKDIEVELNESFSADLQDRVAAIIRRHAEDRP